MVFRAVAIRPKGEVSSSPRKAVMSFSVSAPPALRMPAASIWIAGVTYHGTNRGWSLNLSR